MTEVAQPGGSGTEPSEQSTSTQAKEKVQETAQQVQQQVQEKTQQVRGQASGRLREEIDTRSTQAGEQVTSTADAMRRVGEQLRGEGNEAPARLADQAAERAQRLGGYLTEANADRILSDVENFARRQPWLVGIGGVVLGFLASRFVKASSSRRYESYGGDGYPSGMPAGAATPWSDERSLPPAVGHGEPTMAAFAEESYVAEPAPGAATTTGASGDVMSERPSGRGRGSSRGQSGQ